MNRLVPSLCALALFGVAGAAAAQSYGPPGYGDPYYPDGYPDGYYEPGYVEDGYVVEEPYVERRYQTRAPESQWAYAEVVNVDPIIETVQRPIRREQCWREPVRYVEGPPPSGAAPILGAIIGGVIGNQFGGGSGRVATTAAGVALGAAVATDADNRRIYEQGRYREDSIERCRLVTEYTRDERVVGYDVTYDYQGQTYRTRTDHHPGNRIRVRVDVTPEI